MALALDKSQYTYKATIDGLEPDPDSNPFQGMATAAATASDCRHSCYAGGNREEEEPLLFSRHKDLIGDRLN